MIKNSTPGSSSLEDELCATGPVSNNQVANDANGSNKWVGVSEFNDKKIRLPKSIIQSLQADYHDGKFKCFGSSKTAQLKAFEYVLWLLETIYNRTILREKSKVELRYKDMEKKFGKTGTDKKKGKEPKERKFTWETIKGYALDHNYIKVKKKYRVNQFSYKFWISPKILKSEPDWYYQLKNTTVRTARRNDAKNYKDMLVQHWKGTKRMFSADITKENLQNLVFDLVELDGVCQRFLHIPVEEFLKWEEEVRTLPEDTHSDVRLTPSSFLHIGGDGSREEGEGIPSIYHSEPPLLKGVGEGEDEYKKKQQLIRSLVSLRLGLVECKVHPDRKGGRLYSPIVSLKREARKALRYLNEYGELERLINFDIKTCQPWILGVYIIKQCLENRVEVHPDIYRYLKLIEKKDLYYEIVDFYNLHFKHLPSERDYTIEEEKEARAKARDEVKKDVLTDLYRNYIFKEPETYAGKFIKENFPAVWYWIIDNKGTRSKSAIPVIMQKFEADFFIDRVIPELTERGIWCLTIHDSAVVREKDQDVVYPLLKSLMHIHFLGREQEIKREELFNEDETPLRKSA